LYPGNSQRKIFKGFHEIIPGLGAFAISPDADNSGIDELKDFLCEIAEHAINRASKRETISYYKFNTYRQKTDEVKEKIPEYYHQNDSTAKRSFSQSFSQNQKISYSRADTPVRPYIGMKTP